MVASQIKLWRGSNGIGKILRHNLLYGKYNGS